MLRSLLQEGILESVYIALLLYLLLKKLILHPAPPEVAADDTAGLVE